MKALDAIRDAKGLGDELVEAGIGLTAYANVLAADIFSGDYDMSTFAHPGVRKDMEGKRYLEACAVRQSIFQQFASYRKRQ